jgi:hypothetical protein
MQPLSSQTLSNDEIDPTVFALIIGISDYEHISDLKYAHVDAEAMKTYIEEAFPTSHSTVLTDSAATRKNIITTLANILTEVNAGDTVFIYFSGHGDCESRLTGDPGFLLSHDSPKNNYIISAIRVDELKSIIESYIEKNKAKVILFVDACRAGSVSEGNHQGPGKTTSSLMNLFQNEILFLACKPDQYSLERAELGHGLFTYFLIKGLSGAADGDEDQLLTVEELRRYLYDEVMKASQKIQTPMAQGDSEAPITMIPDLDQMVSFMAQPAPRAFSRPDKRREVETDKTSRSIEKPNSKRDTSNQYEELFDLFQNAIDNGQLTKPEDSCALYYYQLYPSHSTYEKNKKRMKVMLLESLLESSSDFLMGYINDYEFYPEEKVATEALEHLEAGLSGLSTDDFYFNKFKSRALFLEAFQSRYFTHPDWGHAIKLLDSALTYEPNGAYIYYEIGNIYNNQLQNSDIAIDYYKSASFLSPTWSEPIMDIANVDDSREERFWMLAIEQSTREAYTSYLQQYPDGYFRPLAEQHLAILEAEEQEQLVWNTLSRITFKKEYNELMGFKVDVPVFSQKIQKLDGEEVTIKGYIIPIEGYGSHKEFIFSAYPHNLCFFCGEAGPETVIEVYADEPIPFTAEPITIKGKLKLNVDDVNRLIYSLTDAVKVN